MNQKMSCFYEPGWLGVGFVPTVCMAGRENVPSRESRCSDFVLEILKLQIQTREVVLN